MESYQLHTGSNNVQDGFLQYSGSVSTMRCNVFAVVGPLLRGSLAVCGNTDLPDGDIITVGIP